MLLVRNTEFHEWSRAAQPDGYPDRIDIRMDPDPGDRVRLVLRGQSDVALEIATANIAELHTRFASQLRRHAQSDTTFFNFNVRRSPFDDVRARRAVNLALNRSAIASRFGGAYIATPTCQVLPPRFPGHRDDCPWTSGPHNGRWHGVSLTRARALVRASGTSGATVTFLAGPGDAAARAAAPVLAQALHRIGYRPRIEMPDSEPAFGERIANLSEWNIGSGEWIPDYPSPADFFGVFLACSSYHPENPMRTTNSGGFCDPTLDHLVAQAQALQTTHPAAADNIWAHADHLAVDQAAWAPLVNNAAIEFLSTRVGHFTLDASSQPQIDQMWVR